MRLAPMAPCERQEIGSEQLMKHHVFLVKLAKDAGLLPRWGTKR